MSMEFLLLGHRHPSWQNVPSGYIVPQFKQPVGNNSHPNFVVVVVVVDGGEGAGCFLFQNIPDLTTAS